MFGIDAHAIGEKFLAWIGLKEHLDKTANKPPFVNERDVWWVSFGKNVGSEMNGKSERFSRPAVILKKLSHNFYLVAPTTSQKKEGTWYVHIQLGGKDMYVCLHQVRTVDYRRLWDRLGQIDSDDFKRVKQAFLELYR